LVLLAFGAVALLIFPLWLPRAANTAKTSPGLNLEVGLGSLLAMPVFAVPLCVTVIGLTLGFALMAIYPALLVLAWVVGVLALSIWWRAALNRPPPTSSASTFKWFVLALAVLMLLAWLPFTGMLFALLVMLAGLGGPAGACGAVSQRRTRPRAW